MVTARSILRKRREDCAKRILRRVFKTLFELGVYKNIIENNMFLNRLDRRAFDWAYDLLKNV
jgi:hypothetical protein